MSRKISISVIIMLSLFFYIPKLIYTISNSNPTTQEESQPNSSDVAVDESTITFDIKGSVSKPGVYTSTNPTNIQDAIKLAGELETTGLECVNLSHSIKNEEMIIIPSKEECDKTELININTASEQELTLITGVGEVTASSIVNYREQNGTFQTKEDLLNVDGIGEATLQKMADQITI